MLCYDRTKCGVSGPQLARLSQRRRGFVTPSSSVSLVRNGLNGLGGAMDFISVAAKSPDPYVGGTAKAIQFIDQVKNFFGSLFGKSADKSQFDMVRQNVWNQFAAIVDAVDDLRLSGRLTRTQLEDYMKSLQTLITNFDAYYSRVRAAVTPAYGDSRFHDFYDVFLRTYDEWKEMARSMPADNFISSITGSLSSGGTGQMLLLGAVALMFLKGRR